MKPPSNSIAVASAGKSVKRQLREYLAAEPPAAITEAIWRDLLLRLAPVDILKDDDIRKRRTAASQDKMRRHTTDYDLVNACGQWLAVTGTQEAQPRHTGR